MGAGLAGLSAAAAAGERNVGELTIVEAKDEVKALGGGIILQPNAVHALDRLGCLDAVRSAAVPLTHIVQDRAGGLVSIALGEVWPRLRLPTLAVHRHALHAVLLERASRYATVELSGEVVGVHRATGERLEIELADGSARAYDLVVAADGIQSAIRSAVAPETQVHALGLWWARWLVSGGSAIGRSWQTERLGGTVVGTFPLGADELQVFATVPSDAMSDERRHATLAWLESESSVLREASAHGMRLVHVGPAREVRPHVWRADGVVFVGDAAHAMSPTLSAGGSMAIEDGLVLGRLLGTGDTVEEIACRYEQLRKQRLAWMARVGQVQVYTLGGTPSELSRSELTKQLRSMMRSQRHAGAATCIAATAEFLPFPDSSFDAAMSIASHWHWPDEARGFTEMRRVVRDRIVVLTVDRAKADDFWLTAEYLPTAHALWRPVEETVAMIGACEVVVVPISATCADGFYHAFWRRPYAYLDDSIRKTMSVFAHLDPSERDLGLERLRADLNTGRWQERHADLLRRDEVDLGLRLLVHLKGSEGARSSLESETP